MLLFCHKASGQTKPAPPISPPQTTQTSKWSLSTREGFDSLRAFSAIFSSPLLALGRNCPASAALGRSMGTLTARQLVCVNTRFWGQYLCWVYLVSSRKETRDGQGQVGVGLDGLWRTLPTQSIPWFYRTSRWSNSGVSFLITTQKFITPPGFFIWDLLIWWELLVRNCTWRTAVPVTLRWSSWLTI